MKRRHGLALMLISMVSLSAPAQPPAHEADAPPPPMGEPRGPGPGGHPPVHRFFEHIKKTNPEEFERLRQLRESDPEAFREELTRRLTEARQRREEVGGVKPGGRRDAEFRPHPRGDADAMQVDSPELDRLELETRERARSVREAGTADEREKARAALKASLEKSFDLRERLRAERLAKMETRLKKIRQMLDERQGRRDEIIERRVRELTDSEPLAW